MLQPRCGGLSLLGSEAIVPVLCRYLALIAVLTLAWTAPSDNVGVVAYDLRYSRAPITEENFDQATPVIGEPMPRAPGTKQRCPVTGLEPGTRYWFALKSEDAAGNVSPVSNVVVRVTAKSVSGDGFAKSWGAGWF